YSKAGTVFGFAGQTVGQLFEGPSLKLHLLRQGGNRRPHRPLIDRRFLAVWLSLENLRRDAGRRFFLAQSLVQPILETALYLATIDQFFFSRSTANQGSGPVKRRSDL